LPHFVDLVDDGRDGFLYPIGDVAALQKLLSRLMQNPAEVAEVGLRAAKSARERFDVAAEVSALTVLYEDLFARIESKT
jgi:glycosyltransferase involved in cell wall biosynthesis